MDVGFVVGAVFDAGAKFVATKPVTGFLPRKLAFISSPKPPPPFPNKFTNNFTNNFSHLQRGVTSWALAADLALQNSA